MNSPEPLPQAWVDRIFARLTGLYGTRFTNLWTGIDVGLVHTTWAHELAGFQGRPDAIKYALDYLPPDHPPTALAFKKLCQMCPDKTPKLENLGHANPSVLQAVASGFRTAPSNGMRDWAYRLKARHEAGDRLNINQIKCYQAAVGVPA